MKKLILTILIFIGIVATSAAQFRYGFEVDANGHSTDYPPYNFGGTRSYIAWTSIKNNDGSGLTAHSGERCGKVVSKEASFYSIAPAYYATKNFTPVAGISNQFSFWINGDGETYKVMLSYLPLKSAGNGNFYFGASDFTETMLPETRATANWKEVKIDLSTYIGKPIYVAIVATSTDKVKMCVDDIEVGALSSPNCDAKLLGLDQNSITTDLSGNLTWSAASGNPSGYRFSIGTNAAANDIINNLDVGNVTRYNVGKLFSNASYAVKIAPYNSAGIASCDIINFSTKDLNYPNCDAKLNVSTVINGIQQDLSGNISWTPATGAVSGYRFTFGRFVVDTFIGVNDIDVGNVTSYNVGTLLPNVFYSLKIIPYSNSGNTPNCINNYNFTTRDGAVPPLSATTTIVNATCSGSNDASININATGGNSLYQYAITGRDSQTYSTFNYLSPGNYVAKVTDVFNNQSISLDVTITSPTPITVSPVISNLTATLNTTGGTPPYTYSEDGNIYQTSNVFNFATPRTATIYTKDAKGCFSTPITAILNVNAPLIKGQTTANVTMLSGKKLKDIVIDGNPIITWYSTAGTSTAKLKQTSKLTAEIALDPETNLVDGTTYYASQTINGIESTQRLAVTVKLATSLATKDFVLGDFKYYPNPVKNTLTVSNSAIIDEVSITSTLGKIIMTKKINSLSSDIDLSSLSNGIYFLKVKSEGKEKIVKISK
jgi:hypothetical protein